MHILRQPSLLKKSTKLCLKMTFPFSSGQIIPGRPLKRCSPMFVVLALPVAYWSVPTLRAAAKVRTTRRLDSSEITRTLHRFEEVQDPGRAMSLLRYVLAQVCP